jgi:glycerol uptake facilitator-like aquaporin
MEEFSLLLLASSFIFITNVLSTFYKKYYIYSFLFFCLTLTSILVHYSNDIYAKIVDKFFILTIVLYGGYLVCKKTTRDNQNKVFLITITFLLCVFLFYYGYLVNDYCFNPDKHIGEKYHFMLHIISSIGHHFITFL